MTEAPDVHTAWSAFQISILLDDQFNNAESAALRYAAYQQFQNLFKNYNPEKEMDHGTGNNVIQVQFGNRAKPPGLSDLKT